MIGVIDVGGGMRDIYGAGVFDYCLEQGIVFDYCCGVSAGSANLTSYIAKQKGRNYKFYTEYAFRKEYMSLKGFFHTGSYLNLDYIYGTLSNSDGEYPVDYETFAASPQQMKIVATDALTGRAVYFDKSDMGPNNFGPVKASSCLPVVDKPYEINGRPYYDGGLADPIPVLRAFADGCEKVVLILTKPKDLYRDPEGDRRFARILFHQYPNAGRALLRRGGNYNRSLEIAKNYEKEGRLLIVAPEGIGNMKTLTKDLDELNQLYCMGMRDAQAITDFLAR